MTLHQSKWLDIGNGEKSSILESSDQPSNYKSIRIRPWPTGEFFYYVNGEFRGRSLSLVAAKRLATDFAASQLTCPK